MANLTGSFEIFMHTEVTDSETGFTGTIVARTEWEDGRRTYCVQPIGGDFLDRMWFDEDRIRPPAQVIQAGSLLAFLAPEQVGNPVNRGSQ